MESKNLQHLSTFDLFFNMASGKYSDAEKMEILNIIKEREDNTKPTIVTASKPGIVKQYNITKPPLPGSKAEKIKKLLDEGKSANQVFLELKKKKVKIYKAEIYRIIKNFGIETPDIIS